METGKNPIIAKHTSTTDSWHAMIDACKKAEISILLEEFILLDDVIGKKFIKIFIDKAQKGVKVKLLLDWWGCRSLKKSGNYQKMISAGVSIRFFREPKLKWIVSPTSMFPRDHRKLLVIDNNSAFVGGVCLYDNIINWRDTMLHLKRLNKTEDIIDQLNFVFDQTWKKIEGNKEEIKAHPSFDNSGNYSVYANAPDSEELKFTDLLLDKISSAKTKVQLTTPYFVPDKKLINAFKEAKINGAEIEILLSDYSKYAPYVLGKKRSSKLVQLGIKIFYYKPCMLHLKMMIIDNEWCALGSYNLDGLSINHNHEIMLVSSDDTMISSLSKDFMQDKKDCYEYSVEYWRTKTPSSTKIMSYILSPFESYL